MTRPTALEVVEGFDLTGKTCVVTGASSGLGLQSARALAATGAHVVLAARNHASASDAEAWIRKDIAYAQTSTVQLDLASLSSVRKAAIEIAERTQAVHVLMNNAGVMFTPFGRTSDGFELQFGTNHLGHFEFTRLLTPQLVAANGARVVIMSSSGHAMGGLDFDDLNWEKREYNKFRAYGASKTANILHMVELDRQLRHYGVRAYSVNPGAVATSLGRHMAREDYSRLRKYAAASTAARGELTDGYLDFVMPDQGAATQVWAAITPELAEVGSVYLEECHISGEVQPYAQDEDFAAKLWALSEALCS
ncbi:SDR family NAD(P)-dependent oxidoreductase [Nocardia sp. NPDC004123]